MGVASTIPNLVRVSRSMRYSKGTLPVFCTSRSVSKTLSYS